MPAMSLWPMARPERICRTWGSLENSFPRIWFWTSRTCTFGGTRLRMKESKYVDRCAEVNTRAAELARKAASRRQGVLVAGSIGPTGVLMKPYGPLGPEDAKAAFAEQAKALAEGGVDLLVIETFFALDEATAAFEGARSVT